MGATVPHQIELNIAAAAVQLKGPLALAIGAVLAQLNDRQVGRQQAVAHRLHHGQAALEAKLGKVIKKNAAHAALLGTVFEHKILVAPGLEAGVFVRPKGLQSRFASGMKVAGVFVKAVVGGQVHATAKPAHAAPVAALCGQHAHIHVHCGHIGVAGVKHQRHAHGLEGRAGKLRAVLGGRWRQPGPAHMRETATGPLKHRAGFQNLRHARALQQFAGGLLPGVDDKAAAIHSRHGRSNAGLQAQQVIPHPLDLGSLKLCCRHGHPVGLSFVRGLRARWPISRRYCMPSSSIPRMMP